MSDTDSYSSEESIGWISWFCLQALDQKKQMQPSIKPFTIAGNGKQVRDLLHSDDLINLYYTALQKRDLIHGQVFNIGGGMEQSLSLLELFSYLTSITGKSLLFESLTPRESDQKVFIADITKVKNLLGWSPQVSATDGILKMCAWIESYQ